MANDEHGVEVTDDFKMAVAGSVYPKTIAKGEIVFGRVAEIALALGKALQPDAAGLEHGATGSAPTSATANAQGGTEAAQGLSAPENKAETKAPDAKQGVDLLGNVEPGAKVPTTKAEPKGTEPPAGDPGAKSEAGKGGAKK